MNLSTQERLEADGVVSRSTERKIIWCLLAAFGLLVGFFWKLGSADGQELALEQLRHPRQYSKAVYDAKIWTVIQEDAQ